MIRDIDLGDGVVHLLQKGGDRVQHPFGPFPDLVGALEAHITLDGRKPDEYLLYPRWERPDRQRAGRLSRGSRQRPLSPRGMHEWWTKRLRGGRRRALPDARVADTQQARNSIVPRRT